MRTDEKVRGFPISWAATTAFLDLSPEKNLFSAPPALAQPQHELVEGRIHRQQQPGVGADRRQAALEAAGEGVELRVAVVGLGVDAGLLGVGQARANVMAA